MTIQIDGHEFKLLKLRNPWGKDSYHNTGKRIEETLTLDPLIIQNRPDLISEQVNGVFYIHLEEFLKLFNDTYICKV